jgi:hypothetical protein
LLDHNVSLSPVPPDSAGHSGFRVQWPGHPDVSLYFDRAGRVATLSSVFATADSSVGDTQQITLDGTMESNGVRWFRTMSIVRAGQPYFDLTLQEFRASPTLSDSLLAGPH